MRGGRWGLWLFVLFNSFSLYSLTFVGKFPLYNELESGFKFWTKIFTLYDVDEYVIHDPYNYFIYGSVNVRDILNLSFDYPIKQELIRSRIIGKIIKYKNYIKILKNRLSYILRTKQRALYTSKIPLEKLLCYNTDKLAFICKRLISNFENRYKYRRLLARSKDIRAFLYFVSKLAPPRYQLGQYSNFKKGIVRAHRILPYLKNIFRREGLPIDLALLPFIESSFNNEAVSYKKAVGIWQLLESTAKEFILVTPIYDERKDPILSTYAAVKFFKRSYRNLKNWPLAITAYNYGVYGIKRALKSYYLINRPKNLVSLIKFFKGRNFGFAARNFYVEFLSAVYVYKNRKRFFGELPQIAPLRRKSVILTKVANFQRLQFLLGVNSKILRYYNPSIHEIFYKGYGLLPKGAKIHLPVSYNKSQYAFNEYFYSFFRLYKGW